MTPVLNLLQGPYAVKKSKFVQQDKIWHVLFGLVTAWVVLLFLYPTVSYLILQKRVSGIDAQIVEIYKRNFPQSSSIVAPKLRMEEKLQKANSAIGQNRLLLLLGYIGKGVTKAEGIKLKHIDFQNNQLTLELTVATSEEFSTFTDFLTQQSLNVKQQNANLTGSRINATLQVE
jgi:type II secretion system protein L